MLFFLRHLLIVLRAYGVKLYRWVLANPATALLLLACFATLVYFYDYVDLFVNGRLSTILWMRLAWVPDLNQEHSKVVPFISLGLVCYHHRELRKAPKQGSNHGLIYLGIGILLFVLAARCLQPRMAIASIPVVLYGAVMYLWGKRVARIILFPLAFLAFMIPVAFIEQATFRLQFVITGIVGFLSNVVGINVQALGTTLNAGDGSFNFEVAEGCSGIRSLAAMAMLVSVYVHLTQDRLWKKIVIFCCSVLFAIIGNAGRIFTVILVAKFYDPKIAGGIYHDYSGYVFFPFAVLAMLGFSMLVNLDWKQLTEPMDKGGGAGQGAAREQVSYDY
jgi:exosortase